MDAFKLFLPLFLPLLPSSIYSIFYIFWLTLNQDYPSEGLGSFLNGDLGGLLWEATNWFELTLNVYKITRKWTKSLRNWQKTGDFQQQQKNV